MPMVDAIDEMLMIEDRGRRLARPIGVDIAGDHPHTLRRQPFGKGPPKAASGAGHDSDPARQVEQTRLRAPSASRHAKSKSTGLH